MFYRNIEVMKQRLKDLWKEGAHICLVPGSTGELAKVTHLKKTAINDLGGLYAVY